MDAFEAWMGQLEARHLADLSFAEVARALRALSATYVERRHRIVHGQALEGRGKRAAFALFYGPLHFILVRDIVASLPGALRSTKLIVDLGCGTGAAGAAWAAAYSPTPKMVGVDRHPWAAREAADTYRAFGISARTVVGDVATADIPRGRASLLAAFVMNELPGPSREQLFARLIDRSEEGDRVLIVEPLAGFVAPWWKRWQATVEASGGRSDEWRVRADLPEIVAKLDRAAGLRHREITGRSLWIPGA